MAMTVIDFEDWLSEGMPQDVESFYSLYRVVMGESEMGGYQGFNHADRRFVQINNGTMTLMFVSDDARDSFLDLLADHRGGPHALSWERWYALARKRASGQ